MLLWGVTGCGRQERYPVGKPIAIANLVITPTHSRREVMENQEVAVIFLRVDGLPGNFIADKGKDAKRWAQGKGFPGTEIRIYDAHGKQKPTIAVPEEMFDALKSREAGNMELAGQRAMNALLGMTSMGQEMPRDWVLIAEISHKDPDFALLIKNLDRRKGQPPAALVVFKTR